MKKLSFTCVRILETLPVVDPERGGLTAHFIRREVGQGRYTNAQIERALAALVAEGLLDVVLGGTHFYIHQGDASLAAAAEQRDLRRREKMGLRGRLHLRIGHRSRSSDLAQ